MQSIDQTLTHQVISLIPHSPAITAVFGFFSLVGTGAIIWIAILIVLIFKLEFKNKLFLWYFGANLIVTHALTIYIKEHIMRTRPTGLVAGVCPHDYSFPSSHASLAFAAAYTLAYYDKPRAWIYYLLATVIAFSRVYLQCHYLGDVAAGIALGTAIGAVMMKTHEWHGSRRSRSSRSH